MRVTKISVGRTYNTGNFTSHRFDLEAELEWGEDPAEAQNDLARMLHSHALVTMAEQGVEQISEQRGNIPLTRTTATVDEDEDDDIPY